MARGKRCTVHRHPSVVSEENHHVQPQSRGGPTRAANMRYLCANAHGDAHYFLDMIEDAATAMRKAGLTRTPASVVAYVPWAKAKHFSPAVRHVAIDGWNRYAVDFLAGKYDAHALIWSSSGQPREHLTYRLPYALAVEWNDAEPMLARARMHLAGNGDAAGPL